MSSSKDTYVSSISPLTSKNYHIWADDMKSWLQLNGLWCLVSGSEKKPVEKPEVLDSKGLVVSPAVPPDKDKLDRWETKAERAAGALKTAMSHELRVIIWDCEDDPIQIWDTPHSYPKKSVRLDVRVLTDRRRWDRNRVSFYSE